MDTGFTELAVALDVDWETFGNAFVQIIRSRDGTRIIWLRRLPAITMTRFRGGFLQRVILPNGKQKKYTFTAAEIIHLRDQCPKGARYALPSWIGVGDMLESPCTTPPPATTRRSSRTTPYPNTR